MRSKWAAKSWRRTAGLTGFAVLTLTTEQVAHRDAPLAASPRHRQSASEIERQAPRGRRLEVLFLGNTEGHRTTNLASMLAARWAEHGLNIWFTADDGQLTDSILSRHDVLIVTDNHRKLTADREAALLAFVRSGKGLVVLHAGSDSWTDSDRYVALVGGQFKTHGGGEFRARILKPDHPIFEGVQEFTTWDETYVHQKLSDDRELLMDRAEGSGREPWAWTRQEGKGRVFYLAAGHNTKTWENLQYQRIVRNAILWTANPEAVSQLEALDIQPRKLTPNKIRITNNDSLTGSYQEPLSIEEAQKHFQVRPGFELKLFASEPDIQRPMAMNWDERGRLWVAETFDFPNDKQPLWKGRDRIKILEDTDGDGKADKFTVFADNLSIPTGITFANGGVIVAAVPEILFLKDTTGDDKADVFEVIHDGWRTGDTHSVPGNLHYGLDNWIWGGGGGFQRQVGDSTVHGGGGLYRFSADGKKFDDIVGLSGNNFGFGMNEVFDVFGSSANNEHSAVVMIPRRYYRTTQRWGGGSRKKLDGHYEVHPNEPHVRQVDVIGGFSAATGHMFYTARAFPKEYWNSMAMVNEPAAHVIHWANIQPSGSSYTESDNWNIVGTDDDWFMPVQTEVGPDGAVWICDFYQIIVQHFGYGQGMEHGKGAAYLSPYRDTKFGRIYRLVYTGKGAKPYKPISLSRERPQELVQTLKNDNMFWRLKAQQLLVERGKTDVLESLYPIAADPNVDELGLNAPAIHALWTIQGLGALDGSNGRALEIATKALKHRSSGVRRNAIRVLPRTDAMVEELIRANVLYDADLQVRLTALLALMEYQPSKKIGELLYRVSADSVYRTDEWLAEGMVVAAARHEGGFVGAYIEEHGITHLFRTMILAARGELEYFKNYSDAWGVRDSAWATTKVPLTKESHPLGNMTGTFWVRKTLEIPWNDEIARRPLAGTLRLGDLADGSAIVYVNGRRVSRTNVSIPFTDFQPAGDGLYVPRNILNPGRNVIAVRLSSEWGQPGVPYDPKNAKPAPTFEINGKTFDLSGDWKLLVEERRSRRESQSRRFTPNVPIAEQVIVMMNPFQGYLDPIPPYLPPQSERTANEAGPPAARAKNDTLYVQIGVKMPMEYDKKLITAKPGQPIKLTFTNTADDITHNWVLYKALSKAALAKEMAAFAKDPKKADRQFVPDSRSVLRHTRLLDPRASETIVFNAPGTAGDYPYICTFPGHWQTMRGILRVGSAKAPAKKKK